MKRRSFLAALFAAPILPAVGRRSSEAVDARSAVIPPSTASAVEHGGRGLPLKVSEIGEVRAGRITSPSGSFIDLDAGVIVIRS